MYTTMRPLALALALAFGGIAAASAAAPSVQQTGNRIVIQPGIDAPAYQVRVVGPNDFLVEMTRLDDEAIAITAGKAGWADGSYRYEIWPIVGVAKRDDRSARAGLAPASALSGSFIVADAKVYAPSDPQPAGDSDSFVKDQVIPDDLIVQSSICAGFDCVDGESFGVDTLRLKENNLRINFDDTSTSAGFAANDWSLVANEQPSGGLNKFSIEDVTGSKIPFTILAGAPSNSLYMSTIGDIGFGTTTPGLDLHINRSDTPAVRFEQNSTGGFSAQTWDIGANEANFFVRDLTGGSRLSFRIRPGAPTSSIDIAANGNVGVGTASPTAKLHVSGNGLVGVMGSGTGGSVGYIDDTGTTRWQAGIHGLSAETAFTLRNVASNSEVLRVDTSNNVGIGSYTGTNHRLFVYHNSAAGTSSLVVRQDGAGDLVRFQATGGTERARLTSAGNLGIGTSTPTEKLHVAGNIYASGNITITGSLSQGSDRNSKENFEPVDSDDVLAKLATLDVTRWNYKVDGENVQHIGPMAQDFYKLFQLGEAETKIAPLDTSGVAIVAIQELTRRLQERDAEIAALHARLERLDAQVAALARAQEAAATTVGLRADAAKQSNTGL